MWSGLGEVELGSCLPKAKTSDPSIDLGDLATRRTRTWLGLCKRSLHLLRTSILAMGPLWRGSFQFSATIRDLEGAHKDTAPTGRPGAVDALRRRQLQLRAPGAVGGSSGFPRHPSHDPCRWSFIPRLHSHDATLGHGLLCLLLLGRPQNVATQYLLSWTSPRSPSLSAANWKRGPVV